MAESYYEGKGSITSSHRNACGILIPVVQFVFCFRCRDEWVDSNSIGRVPEVSSITKALGNSGSRLPDGLRNSRHQLWLGISFEATCIFIPKRDRRHLKNLLLITAEWFTFSQIWKERYDSIKKRILCLKRTPPILLESPYV